MTDDKTPRLLRLSQVENIVQLRHSEIYERMKTGRFPRSVRLGKRCVRWVEGEVREWISSLPRTNEVAE